MQNDLRQQRRNHMNSRLFRIFFGVGTRFAQQGWQGFWLPAQPLSETPGRPRLVASETRSACYGARREF
jgi:hypothetical protein